MCVLLDDCGLAGTLRLTPKPVAPQGVLYATGPPGRPYRDFLTALGLSRAGRAAGISVFGQVTWNEAGTVSEAVHQSGLCTDAAPATEGAVALGFTRGRIDAAYEPGGRAPLRTRCPGPAPGLSAPLAAGVAPRSVLRHGTFTITMRGSGPLTDEGYALAPGGSLTLELRRGRVHQTVQRVPTLAP